VIFGQYVSGKLDISDIAGVGLGPGVNSASLLAHEVAEQSQKIALGLQNDEAGHALAHRFGVAAQGRTSGYARTSVFNALDDARTGSVGGTHQRGAASVTVTFQFVSGNLVKVERKE
jgi:hypothetical protein